MPKECTDCCPEQAAVTVTTSTVTINAESALKITQADVTPGISKNITIQVEDGNANPVSDEFELNLRFVDATNKKDTPSPAPPIDPGWNEKRVVTDGTGKYVLFVRNTGSPDTWYLVASLAGAVSISGAITIGT
jgi:hypothetical protein